MHNIIHADTSQLLQSLEHLKKQASFVFRGHEDVKYKLLPKAFRPEIKSEMLRKLSLVNNDIQDWFSCEQIQVHIDLWAKGINTSPSARVTIKRLLEYCLYVMSLNYTLHRHAECNRDLLSADDRKLLLIRDAAFWAKKETFIHMVTSYFPQIIQLYDPSGRLIQDAKPFEDLAGIDETLPQHYGVPTAALDWSHNPLVSIYFAIGENTQRAGDLAIYALKLDSECVDTPIKQIDASKDIANERVKRQEGTFTYFTKPCSFFLKYGELPSINHFSLNYMQQQPGNQTFELIEFRVERTAENIGCLTSILGQNNINKQYLFPDMYE